MREQGFSIKHITADTFQSAAVLQDLKAHNFECDILSVDRVENNSKICLPYQYLKATIYEKNIEMYKTALLTEEAINLERDGNGRIDHPMGGTVGSKDIVDSLCGSVYTASKYAEEYAYNYGEDYDAFLGANENEVLQGEEKKKQLMVDFEQQLREMGISNKPPEQEKKEDENNNPFIMNDILIW